jgi:hypothetical protein
MYGKKKYTMHIHYFKFSELTTVVEVRYKTDMTIIEWSKLVNLLAAMLGNQK